MNCSGLVPGAFKMIMVLNNCGCISRTQHIKSMHKHLLIIVFLWTGSQAFAQGMIDGYMRGKGNIVAALSYSHESYDTYYVGANETQNPNLGTITTNSLNLFLAGGITDYLDIVASVPYVTAKPSTGYWPIQSDFQDLSIFLKWQMLRKDLGALGELSIMSAAGVSTPLSNYIPDAPVAIGHQSTNTELRLLAQHRLPFGVYVMAQTGYIKRNNVTIDRGYEVSVPDAWDYVVRVGGTYKFLYADAWLNVQQARSGTTLGPGVPFPSNAISYTRTGFNLYYSLPWVKNFGIGAGMGFTLSGENIGKATRYSGSLVYNLSPFKQN